MLKSFNLSLSTVNLTKVFIFCHPCFPAAPGFMCNKLNVGSGIIFKICEWPEMKTCGLCFAIKGLEIALYLGGYPPM